MKHVVTAALLCTVLAWSALPVRAQPSTKRPARAHRGPGSPHTAHQHLRAALILQGVRFKFRRSYIEFSKQSNHIWMNLNREYRQGKITSLKKTAPNATEGEYLLETWRPQSYAGFRTGPSRVRFKFYRITWKVTGKPLGPRKPDDGERDDWQPRTLSLQVYDRRASAADKRKTRSLFSLQLQEARRY